MKLLFRIILGAIVLSELGIMIFSVYGFYKHNQLNKNVLDAVTVVPVHKEFLITSPSAELKYFSEPPPSVIQIDDPEWLPNKATYTINDDSLNERFNYSTLKPPYVYRLIVLGDSFTFGLFVDTKDNWTEQLEDKLNQSCISSAVQKFEVINLGERGYDIKYAAHRLSLRGMKYQPDLIVYFESGTGFDRINELYGPLIEKYRKEIKPEEKSQAKKNGIYYLAWEKTSDDVKRTYTAFQIFEEIHQAWSELFSIRGQTRVVIATFKSISPVDMAKLKLWSMGQPNVSIFRGVRDIYSLNGALPDGHPSVTGHEIIAEDMFKYILSHNVLPCRTKEN